MKQIKTHLILTLSDDDEYNNVKFQKIKKKNNNNNVSTSSMLSKKNKKTKSFDRNNVNNIYDLLD